MTTSTKLQVVGIGNTLEIDPNSGNTCNLLFGQRPIRLDGLLLIRGSGGIINFNDSLLFNSGLGTVKVQSNTAADALNTYVNFTQGMIFNSVMYINRGSVYFNKTVSCQYLGVQTNVYGVKFVQSGLINIGTATAGLGGYTHTIFNTGSTYTKNKFNRIGFSYVNGMADLRKCFCR